MRISFWPTLCNPRGIPSDVLETNRKLGRCIAETAGYANEERRGMICDIHLSLSFLRLFWLPTLISNETLLIREKRKEPTTLVEAHTPRVADTDSNVCSLITLNQVADRWRCYFELNVVSLLDWNSHTGATVPTNSERMKGREAEREREREKERERERKREREREREREGDQRDFQPASEYPRITREIRFTRIKDLWNSLATETPQLLDQVRVCTILASIPCIRFLFLFWALEQTITVILLFPLLTKNGYRRGYRLPNTENSFQLRPTYLTVFSRRTRSGFLERKTRQW